MNYSTTVCIPSRLDNIDFILELLESISKQSILPNKVLIVVSGKPIDELEESILLLKNNTPTNLDIEFITSTIRGLAIARNIGADYCKTGIIIYGDDDDIWHPERIKEIINAMQGKGNCIVRHFHNELIGNVSKSMPAKSKIEPNLFMTGIGNFIAGGSSFAGSTSIFQSIRFTNYKYCEDWDFWIRVLLSDIKVITIKKELVTYKVHSKRMTSLYKNLYKYENIIRLKMIINILILLIGLILGFVKTSLKTFVLYILEISKTIIKIIK